MGLSAHELRITPYASLESIQIFRYKCDFMIILYNILMAQCYSIELVEDYEYNNIEYLSLIWKWEFIHS